MATVADNSSSGVSNRFGIPVTLTGTAYIWIIIGATLDVLLTGIILASGGREANPIANAILTTHGFTGMVIFKYIVVFFILLSCEFVTHHDSRKGRQLGAVLVAIHFAPVLWSTGLLITHA